MQKHLNKKTGSRGEAEAADLLVRKGFQILFRNYRNKWGEVDIVARHGETVVFAEVKTKSGGDYGEPWEMVNEWKLRQVERMGQLWCEEYGWKGSCRVDVVGVWLTKDGEVEKIEHWENAGM